MSLRKPNDQIMNIISNTPKVQGAATFSRAIELLQLIAEHDEPSLASLLSMTGLKRPTLYRMLKVLEAECLIEATSDKTFKVGTRFLHFANRAIEQNEISRLASDEIERLCQLTKETVHLGIRTGNRVIYIAKKDAPMSVRIESGIGGRVPLHASALGKSVLAFLPKSVRKSLITSLDLNRITRFTKTTRWELEKEIDKIRSSKFSSSDQETDVGVRCFGAPIFDQDRQPIAAISISVPVFRFTDESSYVKPLIEACKKVTKQLNAKEKEKEKEKEKAESKKSQNSDKSSAK